jgi:hypothetical protein
MGLSGESTSTDQAPLVHAKAAASRNSGLYKIGCRQGGLCGN